MPRCPVCQEAAQEQDWCAVCRKCVECCECEESDLFDADELGLDPEDVDRHGTTVVRDGTTVVRDDDTRS